MGKIDRVNLGWLILLGAMLVCLLLRNQAAWLITFPDSWMVPLTSWLDQWMAGFAARFSWFFRLISNGIEVPMTYIRWVLHALPWPVIIFLVALAAYAASGWRLAAFALAALFYMVVVGYWPEAMNSLSLVALSVPIAVILGFFVGALGFRLPAAERIIQPCLDLLQTIPAFAYLLPILLLFGFGPVVGLIASVLFAFPPMVRNTLVALKNVPSEIIESGLMSGATGLQLFWLVRVPAGAKQILLGVNQTTMAAFSMIIIASIIGGTADIGWEVLSTMRKAQFGESLLAGIVIALMAMVMDRITAGFADRGEPTADGGLTGWQRYRYVLFGLPVAVILFAASAMWPFLVDWPDAWRVYPADFINGVIERLIVDFATVIAQIKTLSFFFIMLPVKIGLEQTISPFSWGFEFTPALKTVYGAAMAAAFALVWYRRGLRLAIAVGFLAILVFYGLTKLPWPVVVAMMGYLGFLLSGWRLALGTMLGLGFLLIIGVWPQAMLSVYLCGIGVLISFILGSTLGILAAEFKWISRVLRPINDTLQTMPLFVILIPFVMIFKIGEFTALLAIIAYAVVPAIRYAEHGIRSVSAEVVEAATSMGTTSWQLLWRVKLPLAAPVILLGLNQTILYGISMLVITALVGTNGLGQQVYIGLGNGDFGVGFLAGIGMAIIAMIADRLTQAVARHQQSGEHAASATL